MNSSRASLMLLAICLLAAPALSAGIATRDTTFLLGGPDRWDGKFETPDGEADWHVWTYPIVLNQTWHVSTFQVPTGGGQYAMWCGTTYAGGCAEGYGNSWDERLVFTYQVPDPTQSVTLHVTGVLNSDTEPGYDFVSFEANRGDSGQGGGHVGGWESLVTLDGVHQDYHLDQTVVFVPADYVDGGNAQIRFRVTSDSVYSDEDCLYDSMGAVQVDNLEVAVAGGPTFFEDFEDQISDDWLALPYGAWNSPSLDRDLPEADPDQDNPSWQVNWRGYVGDLDHNLDSYASSPPLAVPSAMEELIYAFDVCLNDDNYPESVVFVYQWHVRSTASADPTAIQSEPWEDRDFVYAGPVGYQRREETVGDLLVPGARWVQVAFEVIEYGWIFGPPAQGDEAPYFDNVAVKAVVTGGISDVPDAGRLAVMAYPNPFNPRTTIALDLPQAGLVELAVFDLRGRRVRTLNEGDLAAGHHEIIWDGCDEVGQAVASGMYYYEVKAGGQERIGKLTVVR